jgi:hypothetical protein
MSDTYISNRTVFQLYMLLPRPDFEQELNKKRNARQIFSQTTVDTKASGTLKSLSSLSAFLTATSSLSVHEVAAGGSNGGWSQYLTVTTDSNNEGATESMDIDDGL